MVDRYPTVPFDKLLELVAMGDREPDTLSSLASRLAPRPAVGGVRGQRLYSQEPGV